MTEANLRNLRVLALALLVPGCTTTLVGGGADAGTRGDASFTSDGSIADRDAAHPNGDAAIADAGGEPGGEEDASTPGDVDAGEPIVDAGSSEIDAGGPVTPPPVSQRFVAVGYGGHREMSLDGRTWEHHQIDDPAGGDDPNLLRGVGYGGGVFVAVGNRIMTSVDGIDWTTRVADTGSFLTDAVYVDGVWVAAGGNGYRVRSTDGAVTFTSDSPYLSGHFRGIAGGNHTVVAVGHTYSNEGLWSTSHDGGATWSDHTGGAAFSQVEYGDGVFVAVGDGGRVMVSSDGDTWTETHLGGGRLNDVAFVDGELFVRNEGAYWSSRDGHTWTPGSGWIPEGLTTDGAHYVGFSWGAPIHGADAVDGPWTTVDSTRPAITDIAVSE